MIRPDDAPALFIRTWRLPIDQSDPRQLGYWASAVEMLAMACDPHHEPEVRAAALRKAEGPLRWLEVLRRNLT